MASGPITAWPIDGPWGNNGNSDRLYFWGSKITEDGDCSHEIKRHLLLGRKAMTNLVSMLKSRDVTLPRRGQWHPTPVLLPGKSHGWRSLVGCSPWGCWESDTTERLHSLFTFMHWRRKWQPTPVYLPGESQGRGSLVGCCLWGRTESDMTEAT